MKTAAPPRAVYFYQGRLYVSMTNRCPTACGFCAKRKWKWDYRGTDLKVKVSTELTDEEITTEVTTADEVEVVVAPVQEAPADARAARPAFAGRGNRDRDDEKSS